MGNIVSYLKWRGDLGFEDHAFCEADNLVLSALVYLDFSGIVPGTAKENSSIPAGEDSVTVKEACKQYFAMKAAGKRKPSAYEEVLKEMGESRRFSRAILSCYEEKKEEIVQTQFAAIKIAPGDGTYFLAFRGTDDTIVGWREDFAISYKVVPAQQMAVDYLKKTMREDGCFYRIGGHSKGGNLAVYAAMKSPEDLQEKMLCIYNNDGPGICSEMIEPTGYERIRKKIVRIVPRFCVIGRLFEPDIPSVIVESSGNGLIQHDIMTWKIEGGLLCRAEKPASECGFYNDIFDRWIESADREQRETFTKDFFDALGAGGAQTIPEVAGGGLGGFGTILLSIAESESRTKIVIAKFIHSFLGRIKQADIPALLKSKESLRSWLLIAAGLLFLVLPELAVQSIGTVLAAAGFLWSAKQILDCALEEADDRLRKKRKLVVYLAFLSVMVFLLTHHKVLLVSGNLLMGFIFFAAMLYLLRKVQQENAGKTKKYAMTATAVLLFLTGCVSLVTPDRALDQKMYVAGSFLILYGFGSILTRIYKLTS